MGALRDVARRHGVRFESGQAASMLGGSAPEAVVLWERELGHELDEAMVTAEIYDAVLVNVGGGLRAMDGAVELLETLHGTRALAIASNGSIETVAASLRAAGIPDVFDVTVALGGALRPKPEPDLYVEACRRLGEDPADAIAVEDSPRGATAARRAGLSVVGVGDTKKLDAVCDVVVATLRAARLRVFLDDEVAR
jgi:HAD superfamily hydrolase (TIGR01509 family)